MPGNYELYDLASNRLGPTICKRCWEEDGKENAGPLNTVWVMNEERQMVWWLCTGCTESVRGGGDQSVRFVKSSHGLVASPRFN
jgi:hypothetical protein